MVSLIIGIGCTAGICIATFLSGLRIRKHIKNKAIWNHYKKSMNKNYRLFYSDKDKPKLSWNNHQWRNWAKLQERNKMREEASTIGGVLKQLEEKEPSWNCIRCGVTVLTHDVYCQHCEMCLFESEVTKIGKAFQESSNKTKVKKPVSKKRNYSYSPVAGPGPILTMCAPPSPKSSDGWSVKIELDRIQGDVNKLENNISRALKKNNKAKQ